MISHKLWQFKEKTFSKILCREGSSALPLHLSVVAIEKGAFWSPSTKVANYNNKNGVR